MPAELCGLLLKLVAPRTRGRSFFRLPLYLPQPRLAENRTEPNSGLRSDYRSVAPLERSACIPAPCGGSSGEQHLRTGTETCGASSEECAVLQDPERREGGLRANSFDYLTELRRHALELETSPSEWMP
jgi:hypothetical protein